MQSGPPFQGGPGLSPAGITGHSHFRGGEASRAAGGSPSSPGARPSTLRPRLRQPKRQQQRNGPATGALILPWSGTRHVSSHPHITAQRSAPSPPGHSASGHQQERGGEVGGGGGYSDEDSDSEFPTLRAKEWSTSATTSSPAPPLVVCDFPLSPS